MLYYPVYLEGLPSKCYSDYFTRRYKLPQLVRPTRFERLWLIPAHQDLLLLDRGGGGHPQDEL